LFVFALIKTQETTEILKGIKINALKGRGCSLHLLLKGKFIKV